MNQTIITNENKNKNDNSFIIFLDKLMTMYNEREYDKLTEILIGTNKTEVHEHEHKNGNSSYYDDNSIIIVRVWTDKETKKLLDCLYYVCTDENIIISLNNKMLRMWLNNLNSEMSIFFYNKLDKNKKDSSNKYNEDHRLTFKIKKQTWSDFIKKCKILEINASDGFRNCVYEYIEQKSNMYNIKL